jgi:3-hydroxyisobutyrate dehydrogenase
MAPSVIKTIGFLGTGIMGAPIVRRLLHAGFTVRAWNRTAAKVEPLVAAGAEHAQTPAAAASGVDVLLLCLTDAAAVETALFSAAGVVECVRPPPIVVDFSTLGPVATSALAERLRTHCPTAWVDAPVSGGAIGAEQGKLVIFCGGEADDIARVAPIFAAIAQRFTHVGKRGAGQTLKLCNQLIVSANLVAIAEALALARASGLELKKIPAALAGGFADSLPLQIFGQRMAEGISTPILGELGLMLKDLREINALAEATVTHLPLLTATSDVYRDAEKRGMLKRDLAALLALYD